MPRGFIRASSSVDRELDNLIARLRQAGNVRAPLDDFDRQLELRIAACASRPRGHGPGLSFQAGAIAVAFAIGLFVGLRMPSAPLPAQALLVDVMDP